jgi:hypothetical protein
MNDITSSPLNSDSLWRRIYRFLRAFDEGLHTDEASNLAARVTEIEQELIGHEKRK